MNPLKSLRISALLSLSLLLAASALPSCSSTLDPFQKACDGVYCSGHGECQIQGGKAVCACEDGYHAEGLACVEDADPCEGIDCSGHGECVVQSGEATCECEPGYVPIGLDCKQTCNVSTDCDDGNDCTTDLCLVDGYCVNEIDAEATNCDDGNGCTLNDFCSLGECMSGTEMDCTGTASQCREDSTCDPAGFEGNCDIPGAPRNEGLPCDEGSACMVDITCSNGLCEGGTPAASGTPCNDGLFCNGTDICDGAGVCEHAGDPCGDISCDELNDVCRDEIWYGLGGSDFGSWKDRIGTGAGETMPIGGGISDTSIYYKECGPDGCLGKCGSCDIGEICSGGRCEPMGTGQGSFCDQQTPCETGYDCLSFGTPHGSFCSAQCDPGSGAGCNPPWECTWTDGSAYWCVIPCIVDSECPGDGLGWDCTDAGGKFFCLPEGECTPDCAGKVCGSDGCWGSCGSCDTGEVCSGGQCEPMTTGQGALFCDQTDCESGYDCIGHAMYNNGFFCSAQCDPVSGTGCSAPWECILHSPEYSWCGISCNVDSDCPDGGDGWVCLSDGELGKICLPKGDCTPDCISIDAHDSIIPALIMDHSGNPVVAWSDEPATRTYVKRFDGNVPGGAWVKVGTGSESGEVLSYELYDIEPMLSMSSNAEGDLFLSYPECGVVQYDGNSWIDLDVGEVGITKWKFPAFYSHAASIDNFGFPLFAFGFIFSGHGNVGFIRYDGTSWTELEQPGQEYSTEQWYPSLATSLSNSLVLAWSNIEGMGGSNLPFEVYAMKYSEGQWGELGIGSASGGGVSSTSTVYCDMVAGEICENQSLAPVVEMDNEGSTFVVWSECYCTGRDHREWFNDCRHIYIKKFDGNSWNEVGTGSASGGGINQTNNASFPSIAIDSSGRPVVAWEDCSSGNAEIYVKGFDGTNWVEIGTGSASGGGISNSSAGSHTPSIAIGGGRICVAWSEMGLDYEQIVMRCADE